MAYKPHEVGTEVLYIPDVGKRAAINFYGQGNEPIVVLHGSSEDPTKYPKLIGSILSKSPDAQVLGLYAPGVGESSASERGEAIGELAAYALEAAGVTDADIEDVTVFGHSHGGWAAVELAKRYPGLKVITAGTPVGDIPPTEELVGNLVKDGLRNDVSDAMHGNPGPILEFVGKFATAQARSMTHPAETKERLEIIQDQMAQLSTPEAVETRCQLIESGQVTPIYFAKDKTVLPPSRASTVLPGTHMAPKVGPVEPIAEIIVNLGRAA